MRVRILKPQTGIVDGLSLSQFVAGFIYEVNEPVGTQLVQTDAAIEVRGTDPAICLDDVDLERLSGGIQIVPPDKADDRPERRRRNVGPPLRRRRKDS